MYGLSGLSFWATWASEQGRRNNDGKSMQYPNSSHGKSAEFREALSGFAPQRQSVNVMRTLKRPPNKIAFRGQGSWGSAEVLLNQRGVDVLEAVVTGSKFGQLWV